jgi:two-component system sensor histidine kinase TctE
MARWSLDAWHRLSLRRSLLLILLPGLLAVVGAEMLVTWRNALDATNAAYDRSLFGAVKSIDANISTESGGLGVELPYRLLEFFQLTASGQVFYRVATEDGLVDIGYADLPRPRSALISGRPLFHDADYHGEPVRVASYARELAQPVAGQAQPQRVVIQVAETLDSRRDFLRQLVLQAAVRDTLLVLAASGLLVLAVAWALRPLARLRGEIEARSPQDLTPVATTGIPADVRPLVEAINRHVERNRQMATAQRRFVDDASHQLRTPLTTLATQVGFALRERDPSHTTAALQAIKLQLDATVRQTNQMLALARADSAEFGARPGEVLDVVALAERLTRQHWPQAREAGIDLGFEPPDVPCKVTGHVDLLAEALSNLLHNAIRYTPAGGHVTVRVSRLGDDIELAVEDDGPGMTDDDCARAGERFFRGRQTHLPGSGLGLAIVRSIAERHGGRLIVQRGIGGRGMAVVMRLPVVRDASGLRVSTEVLR